MHWAGQLGVGTSKKSIPKFRPKIKNKIGAGKVGTEKVRAGLTNNQFLAGVYYQRLIDSRLSRKR